MYLRIVFWCDATGGRYGEGNVYFRKFLVGYYGGAFNRTGALFWIYRRLVARINPRKHPKGTTLCLLHRLERRFFEDSRECAACLSVFIGGCIQIPPVDECATMKNGGSILVVRWIAPFVSVTEQRGN